MRICFLTLVGFLSLTLQTTVSAQDYDSGWRAYNEGDYETALNEWRPLAERGNTTAQTNLGLMYEHGLGVEQNDAEAVRWYLLAAEQGNARAQNNLGRMYVNGPAFPQYYAEAARWYRLAAEQGIADAQYNLGVLYEYGQGVPQNYAEAARWYRLAAEQGYANAQFNIGVLYEYGQGVPQNFAEAAHWWRLAAEQGDADAQTNLGIMYQNGQGVPQNFAEAVRLFRLAAEQGYARAQRRLLLLATMSGGSASSCIDWARTSPRSEDRLFIDLFENPALGRVYQTFDSDNPPIRGVRSLYSLYDIPKDEFETTAEYLRRRQNFWQSAVGAGERSLTIGHQRLRFDYDADGRTMKVSAPWMEKAGDDGLPVAIRFSGNEPMGEGYYISASNGFFGLLSNYSLRNAREVLITMDATAGREVKSSGFLRLRFRLPIFHSPSLHVALEIGSTKIIHADLECAVLTTAGGAYYDLLDL